MRFTILFLLMLSTTVIAQPGTEIYLFDLIKSDDGYSVENPKNITNNPGYDNQPSFLLDDSGILMAATRDGQTDIALYDIENEKLNFLNHTPDFSEYSPVQTPDGVYISFIILREDGTQQFWKITPGSPDPVILETERIVGYYAWYDSESYLSFVLATETDPATLQYHHTKTGEKKILAENPGRSFHKMNTQNAIAHIVNKEEVAEIRAYFPDNETSIFITNALPESADMSLTASDDIIMGKGSELYIFSDNRWKKFADLSELGLTGITRLAVSNAGDKLAVVVEE
ncbi:MAG: hypothetical protein JJ966_07410 [Balneolaceae bacterium]|nr:hypothetical protein [Balneolaceae bacterium]